MRFWWVNQNQTFRHEVGGGYLWSPKRNANGRHNPFYEFMREVSPGDSVFSFAKSQILAWGVARSYAYEAPKPEDFGSAGRNWDMIGWRVDVQYQRLAKPFRPADWIERLRPLLPDRYAPILPDGRGVQAIYLTQLGRPLALALAELVGNEALAFAQSDLAPETVMLEHDHVPIRSEVALWEEHLRRKIEDDATIPETEKTAIVLARRGQGRFRELVYEQEKRCRVTGVERLEHLRASHCKPWRDCEANEERLDANNGLMLTPSIDHLFDRGFISFSDAGRVLIAPVAHRESLERMGVPTSRPVDVGSFRVEQRKYLEYHRDLVFLEARVRAS